MRRIGSWLRQPLARCSFILAKLATGTQKEPEEPLQVGQTVDGDSGRTYTIEEILKERRDPVICVYRASCQGKPYLLKNPVPSAFDIRLKMLQPLTQLPHVRPLEDSITSLKIFVYPFLDGDLLEFAKKNLSPATRRNIVRDALRGLAELHDHNLAHNDIKPDNIYINYQENGEDEPIITDVQIGDLEDMVYTQRGGIIGCVCGNPLWRSPEAWAKARQSSPSDIFSFGLFAIYMVLGEIAMFTTNEEMKAPDSWRYILRRQVSYFGTREGFRGIIDYLGPDNEFSFRLFKLLKTFTPGNGMQPLSMWRYDDAEFLDLIAKMTHLDPRGRITAKEALEHPWFSKELSSARAVN
ncbi:kinase-like domain-containing protein [Nemania abortiva]|nr:kinase-like domain-containing protein [Nemania abortiva]